MHLLEDKTSNITDAKEGNNTSVNSYLPGRRAQEFQTNKEEFDVLYCRHFMHSSCPSAVVVVSGSLVNWTDNSILLVS